MWQYLCGGVKGFDNCPEACAFCLPRAGLDQSPNRLFAGEIKQMYLFIKIVSMIYILVRRCVLLDHLARWGFVVNWIFLSLHGVMIRGL